MRYSNLHNHTCFSDGKHTIAENVAAAEKLNMLSLGFSDHSYTACDPLYCMQLQDYDNYIKAIEEAKRYSAIPIYAGIEQDYYTTADCSGFDYVIASIHYIIKDGVCHPIDHSPEQQRRCIDEAFGGNVLDMAKCYYDMLCEYVQRLKPTFVGHFDVITKFSQMPENDDRYCAIAQDAMKQVLKTCPYIELNTGAIARGVRTVPYPASNLLDVIRDNGGKILLSADSHQKENLTFCFDESVALLKSKGFDSVAVFNGKGFDSVSI